jgi:hypothetical protein
MAKKAYQLKADHGSFMTTVNSLGKQVALTPDDDTYETADQEEQDNLDAAVADAASGLKRAEKKEKG